MHYQRRWKQDKTCSIGGCDSPYLAKGMCGLHYKRAAKGEDMHAPRQIAPAGTPCIVDGCEGRRHSLGYCGMHFQRFNRTGDPLAFRRETRTTCTIDDCDKPHMAQGYCHGHYCRLLKFGDAEPMKQCTRCGAPFFRKLGRTGSNGYCARCDSSGPAFAVALRRGRVAANNTGLTPEDKAEALAYRELIADDPCAYCGRPSAAVDHIVPVLHGGADRWDNYTAACRRCNSGKNARSLLDFLMSRGASGAGIPPGREAA